MDQQKDLRTLKDTAEILGCTDKTLRNYIKAGKLSFQEVDSPYGKQYLVDPDEARNLYFEKVSRAENRSSANSSGNSNGENSSLKDLVPTLEGFRADYKEAMEQMNRMSFELGNAQKEVKLLTGETLEKRALEKQIQELIRENERLKAENEFLKKPLLKKWFGG